MNTKTKAPLDHYQPDVKFKDTFGTEKDKKIYLERRDRLMKKRGWKKLLFSFEE